MSVVRRFTRAPGKAEPVVPERGDVLLWVIPNGERGPAGATRLPYQYPDGATSAWWYRLVRDPLDPRPTYDALLRPPPDAGTDAGTSAPPTAPSGPTVSVVALPGLVGPDDDDDGERDPSPVV